MFRDPATSYAAVAPHPLGSRLPRSTPAKSPIHAVKSKKSSVTGMCNAMAPVARPWQY